MEKSAYKRARFAKFFYNSTELLAQAILYKRLPKGCTIEKKVPYGSDKMHVLDFIYKNDIKSASKPAPLMIYVHGGGWLSGRMEMRRSYCYNFVKEGYFVANVDYTYAPYKIFPSQIQELLNSIDFIFEKAEEYNFDKSKVLLAGESAGGYFVLELAAIAKDNSIVRKLGLSMKNLADFDVKAVISNCGVVDMETVIDSGFPDIGLMIYSFTDISPEEMREQKDKERVKQLSPINFIKSNFPPTFVISAAKDKLKPQSDNLKKQFDELGVKYESYLGEGIISLHAWPIATNVKRGKECLKKTLEFVNPKMFE